MTTSRKLNSEPPDWTFYISIAIFAIKVVFFIVIEPMLSTETAGNIAALLDLAELVIDTAGKIIKRKRR